MKPAFALDFRNDAIALLHRTAAGWHQIGRVSLDDPDLPAALGYMRSTALGLSPRGLATKLILPDDQILVTTLDAPGPDDETRRAQIRAGLEGRTPYGVDDLVFDWEVVRGKVHVAVVARETLAEAESFASEHRFNAVSFVAAPASGFKGESFFGQTAQAAGILADGETVEADAQQPKIVTRPIAPDAPQPVQDEAAETVAEPAEPAEAPAAEAPAAAVPPLEAPAAEAPAAEPVPDDVAPQAHSEVVTETASETEAPTETAAPPVDVAPEPAPAPRTAPIFGLADDEPAPSAAFTTARQEPEAAQPELPPADLFAAWQRADTEDEAPMAVDVEDSTESAAPEKPAETKPDASQSAGIGFASRRASSDAALVASKAPPAVKPTVDRPTAARPLVAPPAPKAERPAPSSRAAGAKDGSAPRGLGALVTAPGLSIGRKKAAVAAPAAPNAAAQTEAAKPAAKVADPRLTRGLGNRPVPVRGKPRYLGLILTALLLLILAIAAALSTSLAFRTNDTAESAFAAADEAPPAAEDEMLADGEDPEALAGAPAQLPAADETAQADQPPQPATDATAEAISPAPGPQEPPAAAMANPGATSGDEIFLAASDQPPVTPEPLDPPDISAKGEPLPEAQAPPPPFGTVYQFDSNGQIIPTPEGIITPEGVRLVAGKPAKLPKARPADLVPPASETAAADTTADTPVADAFAADPALAGFRPKARPEGLVPPAPAPAAQDDGASLAPLPAADSRLVGLRPKARPETVLAAGQAALAAKAAAAASLTAQAEAASGTGTGSKLAVAISRRPQARPQDLSRAVEAAVAAAMRSPAPEPEPEPEQLAAAASLVPKAKPQPAPEASSTGSTAKSSAPSGGRDTALEADEEPDSAAAPRVASTGSVAKQATFKNVLSLDKTALIGVYGTPSKRYAMVRTANGRYKKVKVGDSIDGGKVQAITANEVRYQKGTRLVTLALPKS